MEERVQQAQQLEQTGKEVAEMRLEMMARDLEFSEMPIDERPHMIHDKPQHHNSKGFVVLL